MNINLLVLNIGNSRLAIGTFVAGELTKVTRIPHAQRGDWPEAIANAWSQIRDLEIPSVAAAGVNPPLIEPLEQIVRQQTAQQIEWVGRHIELPLALKTNPPDETGVDRVLNMAAAYEQMQKSCIVVDAGTAITVDVCNDAGEFLGGAISPGLSMMLDALHERTAKLPRVNFKLPETAIGASTSDAIVHGVYHGIRGMVKELAENYATKLGNWPEIIATGGDAERLLKDWELIHAISPDLTLWGIALAYANHHIKHGT